MLTSTGAWLPIAAAVLDVGRFEQSPVRDWKGEREKGQGDKGRRGEGERKSKRGQAGERIMADLALNIGEQGPKANTLGYLVCWRVSLLMSINPVLSARGEFLMASGGDMYGVTCMASKFFVVSSMVLRFLKVATLRSCMRTCV